MTTFSAAYRATVFRPRSVDPTELLPLEPRTGSLHANAFRVATVRGLAGWQPFLEAPRGWHGQMDPLSCATEIGALGLRIMDKRLGFDNLQRWVTAFLGNDEGVNQLSGCKVLVEECVDWDPVALTGTWSPFFTGRVELAALESSYLWFSLQLKALSDDLEMEVFGKAVHASITYAHRAPIAPIGIVGPYGIFQQATKLRGTVEHTVFPDGRPCVLFRISTGSRNPANLVTQGLVALRAGWDVMSRGPSGPVGSFIFANTLRAVVTHLSGASSGSTYHYDVPALGLTWMSGNHWFIEKAVFAELAPGTYGVGTLPAHGVSVDLYFTPNEEVSDASPILVNDVHPAQLLADLADGKFGPLKPDGSIWHAITRGKSEGWVAGDPWSPIIADASIPVWRGIVSKKAKLNDWAEKHVLKPNRLALRIDGDGSLVLVDLRRKATTSSAIVITDADCIGQAPSWKQGRQDAITFVTATLHLDEQVSLSEVNKDPAEYPAVAALVRSDTASGDSEIDLPQTVDFGFRRHTVDFPGLRAQPNEMVAGKRRVDWMRRKADEMLRHIRGPFGTGPAYLELACRRTANTTCKQGQWRRVNVSAQPNPAAGQRGGERIMLCVGRREEGPIVRLSMLDAGPSAASVVPAISLDPLASNPKHGAQVTTTLNASSQPVAIHTAVVEIGDPRPAEDDARWALLDVLPVTGAYTYETLPSGKRVYLRGRSESQSEARLPSAWAFPAGSGYVDTTAYAVPGALAAANLTKFGADLSWTASEPLLEVEVLVAVGVVASFPTSDDRVALLLPGSVQYKLRGLDGPGVQHTVGVRYRDPMGSPGPVAILGVLTTSSAPASPAMLGIDIVPLRS